MASRAQKSRVAPTSAPRRSIATSGKLSVAEPSSLKKFAIILMMHVCKKYLLVQTGYRLAVYFSILIILSFLTDLFPFPRTFFSDRHNLLNQFFIRFGWGWTLLLMCTFIIMTSFTYCAGNRSQVRRHLIRPALATVWWLIATNLFNYIDSYSGHCSAQNETLVDKKSCRAEGYNWVSFDVSGHAFLLIHCLLCIVEEVRCILGWERIAEIASKEDESRQSARLSEEQLTTLRNSYDNLTTYVRLNLLALTLQAALWEAMLLATTIYYHNMPEKLIGGLVAVGAWILTYQVSVNTGLVPKVGEGAIQYMKVSPSR